MDAGRIYVEGANQGVTVLTLNWTSNSTVNGKPLTSDDSVKITVFNLRGPQDVPGTSTYTYAADGGAVGPGASKWVTGFDATISNSIEDPGSGTDTAKYTFPRGPALGLPSYLAGPGYIWSLEVYVVRVDVTRPDVGSVFTPSNGAPTDNGIETVHYTLTNKDVVSKVIDGRNANGDSGITSKAKVTLTGYHKGLGTDKIRTGFIQTVLQADIRGTYGANGQQLINTIGSKTPMNDAFVADAPWYKNKRRKSIFYRSSR